MLQPDVARLFDAVSDPTRLLVVQLLGDRPYRAGELARAVGASPPSMSRHLRVLLRAGVVSDERPSDDARTRLFRLRPESVSAMQAWLDELQAAWDQQLDSFKQHVERRSR